MKKRFILRSLALISCLAFSLGIHAADDYDFIYYNLKFVITSSTTVKVVGPAESPQSSWTIPNEANGYDVTEIGSGAFENCNKLTGISIGSKITTIGTSAFYGCSALTRVNITNLAAWCRITFTGNATSNPLYYARHLYCNGNEVTDLTIPDGVQSLGSFVFYNCEGITSVTLPNSVTSIGWSCFANCTNLKTVNLGSGITRIISHAFSNIPNLTTVTCMATIPPTMDASNVFSDDTYSNATLQVPKGYLSAYQAADYWNNFTNIVEAPYDFVVNGIYYSITGSNTVKVTYRDTNYNSYGGDVYIPGHVTYNGTTYEVTEIGTSAFQGCTNMTVVSIPSTITTMNMYAFSGCTGLTRVEIVDLAAWCRISFMNTAQSNPLYYAHHLYLNGTEVTDLTIPDGIQELGNMVFYGCEGLTDVTIPDGVTNIGWSCFCYCSNLDYLTLGSDVSFISQYAFAHCPRLHRITSMALTPPQMGASNVFDNDIYDGTGVSYANLYVPKNRLSAYQDADWWKNFSYIRELGYSFIVNDIYYTITGNNAVEVSYKIIGLPTYSGNVTIPSTVRNKNITYQVIAIGNTAFMNCSELTNVTIPNSVTEIGVGAFFGCTGLTEVTIPNSVTTMGQECFEECTNLTTLTLGSGLTDIGVKSFFNCTSLTNVTCLATTPPTMADSNVFDVNTYNRATLTVPKESLSAYQTTNWWKNFNSIQGTHYDFEENGIYYIITDDNTVMVTYRDSNYNSYSGSVFIPSSVTHNGTIYQVTVIDRNAFLNSESLTRVSIPNTVTTINSGAFGNCVNLTRVNITDLRAWCNIRFVSDATSNPLYYAHHLYLNGNEITELAIPSGIQRLGAFTFIYCQGLTSVILPSSITFIGWSCFNECTNLTSVTCMATTPPVMENHYAIDPVTYNNATLYVPKGSKSAYQTAEWWMDFTDIQELPSLDEALNVTGGNIHFTSDCDYPWIVRIQDNGLYYAQSGNKGYHSTTSTLSTTLTVRDGAVISFDFKARGEGTSTPWDKCIFSIDDVEQFCYGEREDNWESYSISLSAGTHTFTWTYSKDGSISTLDDYFAVKNVCVTGQVTTTLGDVNGDGQINVADVTALIAAILSSTPVDHAVGDLDGSGQINVADVTALIQIILNQ